MYGGVDNDLMSDPVVDFEDDGEEWLWVRHHTRQAVGITGKHLFFSPDRALLVEIARQEIAEHGFAHAKVSRSLEGSQIDYVLCLYDSGPERVGELRHRHQQRVRCPGWKGDDATDRGVYSKKYLDSLRTAPHKPVPASQPIPPPARMTLQASLEAQIGDAARRKTLRSVGSDVLITAVVQSDHFNERRHRTLQGGRVGAAGWRAILKAWEHGDRDLAEDLFAEHYGLDSGWGGQTPGFTEIERLVITPKARTPRGVRALHQ
jgi:hypothetical protein